MKYNAQRAEKELLQIMQQVASMKGETKEGGGPQ
jgi:hypothetical protein